MGEQTVSNTIKPIETRYNGYTFRSRLEARWAVFFDKAGIQYQYEPQGFTDNVEMYLPDFYLSQWDTYAEVKGDEERYHNDLNKIYKIIKGKKSPIRRLLILGNIPYNEESNGVFWFPVLYYHPLKDSVIREYRAFILRDDIDKEAIFPYDLSLVPDNAEHQYRKKAIWEKNFNEEVLDPIPDTVFMPSNVTINEGDEFEDSIPPYRISKPSPKLAVAYCAAREERF